MWTAGPHTHTHTHTWQVGIIHAGNGEGPNRSCDTWDERGGLEFKKKREVTIVGTW